MKIAAGIPIVNRDGTPTVEFMSALTALENGMPTCEAADLANVLPAAGWHRYLTDEQVPVYGDGTAWRYADGTPV